MCALVLHVCVCPPSLQVRVPSSSPISKNKPKCQDKELASLRHSVTHTHTHLPFALSWEEGEEWKKKNEIMSYDDAVPLFFNYNKLHMVVFSFAVCVCLDFKANFLLYLHVLCITVFAPTVYVFVECASLRVYDSFYS